MKVSMFTTSRTFTFSNLAALLNYGATFAITYEVSIYLQMVKGFSSDKAGMILIFRPAVQALLSPKMGALSDRIRPSLLASGGMGLCAVALVMLALLPEKSPTAYIIAVLCLAGLGFAMFSSPNNNAIMSCVPHRLRRRQLHNRHHENIRTVLRNGGAEYSNRSSSWKRNL